MTAHLSLLGVALMIATVRSGEAQEQPSITNADWPLLRRDPQNTAFSPLPGRMTVAPEERVRYPLGGLPLPGGEGAGYIPPETAYLPVDLSGDGLDEIVTTAGGPVSAFSGGGRVLWRTMLVRGQPNLIGAADLDGCGRREVVCATAMPATIHILSGRDGSVLWERSFDEQVYFMQGTRIADLDADGRPELFVLGNAPPQNSGRLGWAFSFADGFAQPRLLWAANPLPFNPHFRPQTIVADIDGDGRNEVVIASAVHAGGKGLMVAAFDGATGELKRQVDFPNGDRNYGHMQAVRTGSRPQLDLLVVGMLGRSHITFLANDEAGMREVWHVNGTFQIPYDPVADVDGDGKLEVVFTQVSDQGGVPGPNDAVLTVLDLATGAPRRSRPGMRLQGIPRLDDQARARLIATTVPGDRIILDVGSPTERELPIPGAWLCLTPPLPPLRMVNEVLHDRSGYDVLVRDIRGDGTPLLFVTVPGKLLGLDLRTFEPRFECPIPTERPWLLLGTEKVLPGPGESLILAGEDGLHVVQPDGPEAARIEVHDLPARVPIVSRLQPDGPAVVLVSPGNRDMVALDGPSLVAGQPRGLWRRRNLGGFQAPTVCDLDRDGEHEVILCDYTSGEVAILDASGVLKRRLPPLPTDGTPLVTGTAVVGRFGDGSRLLIGAVSGVGPNDGAAKWTTLDPDDGHVLWSREGGPHPRRTPAVIDANGDGVDDLVYSHYFDLCVADGRSGEYLSYVGGSVPGYHIALVSDLDESGTPSVLLSGGYGAIYRFDLQGKELWRSATLDYNAGSAAAIGDVDGDGKLEFGTAFTDRFACCDAATGHPKWELALPGKGSDVVCCDIDGDGRPEFLFGCADGHLYAVQADRDGSTGDILWQVPLGAPVGSPVVADLDGDGLAEVLVCTQDGYLHVLAAT